MNSGTSCLCLYYYYSVMTYYTADRNHVSAHTVLLSRLRSSWDGLARERVDHDHHHCYQCHQLPSPSSFLFCRVAAEETKRLSVNRLFSSFFSPIPLLSSMSTASQAGLWELWKCVNHPSTCAIAHCTWMKERKRMKKGKCFTEKCVQSGACVCVQAVPTYFIPLPIFPIWACWYIAETFLKRKKKRKKKDVRQAGQDRRTA